MHAMQCSVPSGPQDHSSAEEEEMSQSSKATEVRDPQEADTAVFYSISSTQKGLAGIDLGNFLIKQVAQRVLTQFPNVETLITLSPIPGFRTWLQTQVEAGRTAGHQADHVVWFDQPCLAALYR